MEEVGTDNPLHAARHEAGHAIVAVRKGFHPRSLRLWREDGRWVGDCDCGEVRLKTKMKLGFGAGGGSTDTTDAENHIAQAVAGALAQTRTVAEDTFGTPTTFRTDAPIEGLIHILLNEVRMGENVRPGRCEVQFNSDGDTVNCIMEGAWVSGADVGGLRKAAESTMFYAKQATEDAVREAMTLLNDEANWQAIALLADQLVRVSPSGEPPKHVLQGDALAKLIETLGVTL